MARLTAGRALAAGRITPSQAAPLVDVLAEAESPAPARGCTPPPPAPDVVTARLPKPRRPE
jgi:hypothetical protein